eukprot:scaffold25964_cov96-Isochrysis_galbana.AAC.1
MAGVAMAAARVGVITRGMRGREMLFVEDMMESIDNTLAKNTQYLGKPAERLHFLLTSCGTSRRGSRTRWASTPSAATPGKDSPLEGESRQTRA